MGSIIPLLTDFEKKSIGERQALPEKYLGEKICAAVVFSGPPRARPDVLGDGCATHDRVGKVDKNAIVKKLGS